MMLLLLRFIFIYVQRYFPLLFLLLLLSAHLEPRSNINQVRQTGMSNQLQTKTKKANKAWLKCEAQKNFYNLVLRKNGNGDVQYEKQHNTSTLLFALPFVYSDFDRLQTALHSFMYACDEISKSKTAKKK
jgi:exopolysaccharide biosynthesis protein